MKKHTNPARKSLLLSTEKVRDLKPLAERDLQAVVGGWGNVDSEPCLSTRTSGA